jgi:hypothetical protein
MGCVDSVPISASTNDELREIEHATCNNSPITHYQNNKSIIYNSYGYKLFPRNNL